MPSTVYSMPGDSTGTGNTSGGARTVNKLYHQRWRSKTLSYPGGPNGKRDFAIIAGVLISLAFIIIFMWLGLIPTPYVLP
jgi:hypothetical protein